jgi:hypothetical protein
MALFGLADVAQACPFLDVNQTRPWGIANNVAQPSQRLSETITFACCATLPTIALPPSPTDTFCTVMAAPPWLR